MHNDTNLSRPQKDPEEGVTAITPLIMEDLESRRELGINKYGTELKSFNGRDSLRDAYEEALDLALYLKQAMIERDSIRKKESKNK